MVEQGDELAAVQVLGVVAWQREFAAVFALADRVAAQVLAYPVSETDVAPVNREGVVLVVDVTVDMAVSLVVDVNLPVHVASHDHIGHKNWLAQSSDLRNKDNAWLLLPVF